MARIGVHYDLLPRESDILGRRFWATAFELLKKVGAAELETNGKNAGCWVMRLEGAADFEGMEDADKVLVRSNGTVTYTGKDVAYQLWKLGLLPADFEYEPAPYRDPFGQPEFHASDGVSPLYRTRHDAEGADPSARGRFGHGETVINVIDVRQSYLQKVVKEAVRRAGFPEAADRSIHFAYEMVALTPASAEAMGVESLRRGPRPLLRRDVGAEGARREGRRPPRPSSPEKAREQIARAQPSEAPDLARIEAIAVGALRVYMTRFSRNKVIAFDFDEALAFEGDTGPYLQYAAVRAANIFRKLEEQGLPGRLDGDEIAAVATLARRAPRRRPLGRRPDLRPDAGDLREGGRDAGGLASRPARSRGRGVAFTTSTTRTRSSRRRTRRAGGRGGPRSSSSARDARRRPRRPRRAGPRADVRACRRWSPSPTVTYRAPARGDSRGLPARREGLPRGARRLRRPTLVARDTETAPGEFDECRDLLLVAESDGRSVGSLLVLHDAPAPAPTVVFSWLVVEGPSRGQGIGKDLFGRALETCRQRGIVRLRARCSASAAPAAPHLYWMHGFRVVELVPVSVGGRPRETLLFEKLLDPPHGRAETRDSPVEAGASVAGVSGAGGPWPPRDPPSLSLDDERDDERVDDERLDQDEREKRHAADLAGRAGIPGDTVAGRRRPSGPDRGLPERPRGRWRCPRRGGPSRRRRTRRPWRPPRRAPHREREGSDGRERRQGVRASWSFLRLLSTRIRIQ